MARQARASGIPSRELFEKNPLPMWVYDLETMAFLAVNAAAVRQYGYSHREFLAMTIKEIRPPEEIPALLEKVSRPVEGHGAAGTWRHRKKDGTIIDVEITTHTLRFAGRKAKLVLANDITERKRLEQGFNTAAREWRKTFDAMDDAIAWIDRNGRIVRCNLALTILVKKNYHDIIGHRCEEVVYGTAVPAAGCPFNEVMTTHKRATSTLASGSQIYKVSGDPLFDESGEFIGAVHIMSDVTQQERAEIVLKQSVLQQQAILDNIPDIAWLKDDQGRFLAANVPFGRACGFAPADLVGKTDLDIWPRELAERYRADDREVMQTGRRKVVEEPLTDKEEKITWFETIKTPIIDDKGHVVGTTGIARDITARRQTEEALIHKEHLLSEAQRIAHIGSWQMDPVTEKNLWSDELHRIFGTNPETFELSPETFLRIVHHDDRKAIVEWLRSANAGERQDEMNFRVVRPDGAVRWLRGSVEPVFDAAGRPIGARGTGQDITERKKLQDDVNRISHDWEETFNTITDMVTVHDRDFNIIRANKAAEKILGLPFLQAKPVKCFEYYHGTGCPPAYCPGCASLVTGEPSVNELFEPHLGRNVEIRAIPRFDSAGQIAGLIHVVRDITERTRAEETKKTQMRIAEFGLHIGTALNKKVSLQEILGACTDLMVNYLGAAFARLWTVSPDEKMLVLQGSSGIYTHRDGPHGLIPMDENGKIPVIARTRKPHLTNNVIGDPQVNQEWAVREGMVSFAGFPLQVGNHLVGVMGFFSRKMLDDYTFNALESVANNIASGIERLLSEDALKRYSEELAALSIASNDLLALSSLPEIYDGICRFAEKVFGVDLIWIGLIGAGGSDMTIAGYAGTGEEYLRTLKATPDDSPTGGPTGRAIRSKQPGVARKDSPEFAPSLAAAEKYGFETALAVPLISPTEAGICIGALNFYSRVADYFTPDRVRLCQIFANQAAIAIENARLIAGLEEKVAARTREIEDTNSELQHVNKELELRRLEAESASRTKSDFLANMSHELRTPLNAIIGFSDIMVRGMAGPLAEKPKEYLGDILASGKHLLSLINDILDLSKVEAGKMEIEPAEYGLAELIDRSLVLFREKAAKHRLDLRSEIAGALEPIFGDERKIRQVVYNLLSNAVKFTPDGGAVILRARTVRESGRDDAEISVSDTGIGIKPEEQQQLFQPFRQLGHHLTKEHEGTGLGLALCKSFVEMHGGSIRVESDLGRGSTFTFRIPRRYEKGIS